MTETSGPAPTSSTPTPEPRRALSPWTAGGESVNIKLPDLTYFHYAQNDTKLNSAVWAMFPVEKDQKEIARELDVAHRVLARTDPGLEQYNLAVLFKGIRMYEEATVAAALLTLCEIYRGLGQGGKALRHPLETLRSRKAACIVSSLQDVVAIAQLRKVDGDTLLEGGDTWSAIHEYYETLLLLYPWTPTRLLLSADDAFSTGLAELYASLWLKIAQAAKARHATLTARGITTFEWLHVVFQTSSVISGLCYVDRYTLSQAFGLLADTNTAYAATISTVAEYSPTFSEAALDTAEATRCQRYLERLILQSHTASHAEPTGGVPQWAHQDCIDDHSGCGCGDAAVRQMVGSAECTAVPRPKRASKSKFTV